MWDLCCSAKRKCVRIPRDSCAKGRKKLTISSKRKKADNTAVCMTNQANQMIEEQVKEWLDYVVGRLEMKLLPEEKIKMAASGNLIADFINKFSFIIQKLWFLR